MKAFKPQIRAYSKSKTSHITTTTPPPSKKRLDINGGVFPPIPTPFFKNGEIDFETLERNTEYFLKDTPLTGLVVLGSNGEFSSLSLLERIQVLETVSRITRKHNSENENSPKRLIAGTGSSSTFETVELTMIARDLGYDAAMIVTPFYFSSRITQDNLIKHYTTVCGAVPEIPVLLYNVPPFAGGVTIAPSTVSHLAKTVPSIIGIKDTTGNIVNIPQTAQEVRRVREESQGSAVPFQIFAGSGSYLMQAMTMGATGGVCALANLLPHQTVSLYNMVRSNQLEQAVKLQNDLVAVNQAITADGGVAALKFAIDYLHDGTPTSKRRLFGGPPRLPLLPVSASPQLENLKAILDKFKQTTRD